MRIELENLEDGRGEFSHVYQPETLDLGDDRARLIGTATVKGNVRVRGTEAFVTGHVEASVAVDCDRCLTQVEMAVNAHLALEFITVNDYGSTMVAELTDAEMSVSVFDGEGIDVDETVKEQILLSVPTRTLCQENCKGICPNCGSDRNAGDCGCDSNEGDPRWAALGNLMNGKQ